MTLVAIRADASREIGTGHVVRMLSLVMALREEGAGCVFLAREMPATLTKSVLSLGCDLRLLDVAGSSDERWEVSDADATVVALAQDRPDVLVVDHYGLGKTWERSLRKSAGRICVVDDLANRDHDCDVLIDQTLGRLPVDYESRIPADAEMLLGPKFAFLRPEFRAERPRSLHRRDLRRESRRVLVSFGGLDDADATGAFLASLEKAPVLHGCHFTVILGSGARHLDRVGKLVVESERDMDLILDAENMAEAMALADLSVGAGGTTAWERCCLGVPSVIIRTATNQDLIAKELDAAGAAIDAGGLDAFRRDPTKALTPLRRLEGDPDLLRTMSERAAAIVDGRGAERAARMLISPAGSRVTS